MTESIRTQRRREWLEANGPCALCGGTQALQADHINPATKDPLLKNKRGVQYKQNIWAWNDARRKIELAKCQVLCGSCHRVKTNTELLKEVCVNGHPMTPDNIYSDSTRARTCNACRKIKDRKRIAKRSELRLGRRMIKKAPRFVEFS